MSGRQIKYAGAFIDIPKRCCWTCKWWSQPDRPRRAMAQHGQCSAPFVAPAVPSSRIGYAARRPDFALRATAGLEGRDCPTWEKSP